MASTMMSMEKGQTEADVDFIRHMVLNSLRMYRTNYSEEYGELVICCDSPHSWRKEHFPQYKASRKASREESLCLLYPLPFPGGTISFYNILRKSSSS